MQAEIGDRVHVHSHMVGVHDQVGEILEVRGSHGQPPYLVQFNDGHQGLIFPGPDAVIEHPTSGPNLRQRVWTPPALATVRWCG